MNLGYRRATKPREASGREKRAGLPAVGQPCMLSSDDIKSSSSVLDLGILGVILITGLLNTPKE
jgi:hypothetical protein